MKKPKHISKNPGVYIFRDFRQKPLYVGKAGNLKKRLAFYFSKTERGSKISRLLGESEKLQIIETDSEIEALIKETELIKKHLPKYNVLMRDDKNYFYIGITNEIFPRIFITHQPNFLLKTQITNHKSQTNPKSQIQNSKRISNFTHYIGPFTDGNALKTTLRLLRRIFPYCTCKESHKRPCLNAEIGRCPGYCCIKRGQLRTTRGQTRTETASKNQETIYKKNIKNIIEILSGKKGRLLAQLKREMRKAAKKQEFEKAAVLRDQIWGLENIFEHQHLLVKPLRYNVISEWQTIALELKVLLKTKKEIKRIEGYDISNISGMEATGSMVVFTLQENGYAPDKSQYRKFKIKTVHHISDVDMFAEVIKRRFNHPEWQYPDLIVVDGGKGQLNAAVEILRKRLSENRHCEEQSDEAISKAGRETEIASLLPVARNDKKEIFVRSIPIITALAKQEEELYIKNRRLPIKLKQQPKEILHLFQRVRDESHRFAKKYHHKLREMKFLSKF